MTKMKPSADAGHLCDFDEESPGVRLAIDSDVDVGSPGVSLAVDMEVDVAIDMEAVYTGNEEVNQMKREQCVKKDPTCRVSRKTSMMQFHHPK